MDSFTKRGIKWQYTVSQMIDGKSKPIRKSGFRTKKVAQIAATEVEASIQKGIMPHLKKEIFIIYFEEWVKTYKTSISDVTFKRYQDTLRAINANFKDKHK